MRSMVVVSIGVVCVLAAASVQVGAQARGAQPPAQQTQQTPPPAQTLPPAQTPPAGAGRAGGVAQAQAPTNLKVLPKDMTGQQVTALMRTFTASLGVQCIDCHVSQQDHASDDKPLKLVGRKMIAMTAAINDQYLRDVGEPLAAGTQKVTCYTCHRGTRKPLNAPPIPGGGGTM